MIYFCIPAFNEERTVGVVLWKLRQVMTEMQRDFQIIAVDDASTDGTPEVLNPYTRVLPLTLFRNEKT
ncbi:MAG TPA: glycosyltransferase, partial [Longimicrobiales bacterium]